MFKAKFMKKVYKVNKIIFFHVLWGKGGTRI